MPDREKRAFLNMALSLREKNGKLLSGKQYKWARDMSKKLGLFVPNLGLGDLYKHCVYFIQDGEGGPIKIGTTGDLYSRLDSLQTANARNLKLLGYQTGGYGVERALHDKFDRSKIRGEWFEPSDEILEYIKNNCMREDD
jgi:excisionase family DNA binding protein